MDNIIIRCKSKKKTNNNKFSKADKDKSVIILLLIPLTIIIILAVKSNKWIAEYLFARIIYKHLAQIFSRFTGIFPFSLMEVSIYLSIIIFLLSLIYIISIVFNFLTKKKKDIKQYYKSMINIGCMISILFFTYIIFAGVNYHRYSFAEINNVELKNSSKEELYQMNLYLVEKGNSLRNEITLSEGLIDNNGQISIKNMSWDDLTGIACESFENLAKEYPELGGKYGKAKPVYNSFIMSKMGITGIFWPFTLEANVNIDAPDYTIPTTMAHEMAHQRGFMREDEANYIALLASLHSENILFRYSGIMLALHYAGHELYKIDPFLYSEIYSLYNDGIKIDLRASSSYWSQYDNTVINTISNQMNDTYLKVNNQKDGVKSYGRMVDLMLASYKNKSN